MLSTRSVERVVSAESKTNGDPEVKNMGTGIKATKGTSTIVGKTPRRVKVYLLQGEDWLDEGTGYCVGDIERETNRPYFIVRNESNSAEILLKSFLEGSTQYQRQQETLIVWTDSSGKDLALSFQEAEGCAELCEFIIHVQQEKYCPQISLYYVISNAMDGEDIINGGSDITELITGPVNYPEDPTRTNLDSILEVVSQASFSQFTRTQLSEYFIEENYFEKLVKVFNEVEHLKDIDSLYNLCDIVKCFILYNDVNLIEECVSNEENILGLVGIFEYSREHPRLKASYREYITNESKFKTVVELPSASDAQIFKRDFYLNYLKDVVLARFLEDQTFNIFASLIYQNQVEIINYLNNPQLNNNFLVRLFDLYKDEGDTLLKREGVKMIRQYVLIAKALQSFQSDFFSSLIKDGLFSMIKYALQDTDSSMRVLGTELIVIIIEQNVSLVNIIDNEEESLTMREHSNHLINDRKSRNSDQPTDEVKLKLSDDMTLILILSKLLMEDYNQGLKIQVFEALKILLDSSILVNSSNQSYNNDLFSQPEKHMTPIGKVYANSQEPQNEINTRNYFKAFYTEVAHKLYATIIEIAKSEVVSDGIIVRIKKDQVLFQNLCDLISFCSREHETQVVRPFILENHILLGISKMLSLKISLSLKLSALRCLKSIILLNDVFYCRYIVNNNILNYFFDFFKSVTFANNMANSSCLDLLELVISNADPKTNNGKRYNFKLLAHYIYENFSQFLKHDLGAFSSCARLILLVENNFYDSPGDRPNMNTLGSEDEGTCIRNISTPIQEDDIEHLEGDRGSNYKVNRPTNLFEGLEKDLSKGNNSDTIKDSSPDASSSASQVELEDIRVSENIDCNSFKR